MISRYSLVIFSTFSAELKPYFRLENVQHGAFLLAGKLYGLTFHENPDIPVYHPDVRAFEVCDGDGTFLAVLYMGIFGTAVTHSLWNYSLRVMDASFCSMFYPMQPLVSAILGVLFLHETVTPSFILGALMICGGIVAAVKSAPK